MPTTRETILQALLVALQTMPGVTVLREEVLSERLPAQPMACCSNAAGGPSL